MREINSLRKLKIENIDIKELENLAREAQKEKAVIDTANTPLKSKFIFPFFLILYTFYVWKIA